MSLVTVIWSMVAGAALTLVLVHGLVSELPAKKAELRRSEGPLRVAAEASGAGLWALEGAAGPLWTAPKVLELFGLAGANPMMRVS